MLLLFLPALVNHDLSVLVQTGNIAITDTELCAVIVASAGIEIDVYLPVTDGLDKLVLVEVREFEDIIIEEVFLTFFAFTFTLNVSPDIEAIFEFRSGLMKKVVETPVRNNVEITEVTGPIFNTLGPTGVALVGVSVVEDYFNFTFLIVDIDFETTIRE